MYPMEFCIYYLLLNFLILKSSIIQEHAHIINVQLGAFSPMEHACVTSIQTET